MKYFSIVLHKDDRKFSIPLNITAEDAEFYKEHGFPIQENDSYPEWVAFYRLTRPYRFIEAVWDFITPFK